MATYYKRRRAPTKPKPKKPKPRSIRRPRPKKKNDCFITTACTKYYGLPNNCYQLQTLRNYRDNILINEKDGNSIIQKYNSIAPILVKLLQKDRHRKSIFKVIFDKINDACYKIESCEYSSAKDIYRSVVRSLMDRYSLSD